MNDVFNEDQTDEGILGGIVGAAKGLLKGAPVRGYRAGDAQSQGLAQVKKTADSLYKDFFKQMGSTGQQPNGNNLIAYLTSKQYPVKMAQAVINAQVKARATTPQGNAGASQVEPTLSATDAAQQDPNQAAVATDDDTINSVVNADDARLAKAAARTDLDPKVKQAVDAELAKRQQAKTSATQPAVLKPNPARDQAVAEARGYTIALDANTAYKAILAAAQENLRIGGGAKTSAGFPTGSTTGSAGVANTGVSSGTRGGGSASSASGITADAVINWFASQPAETRNNVLTALNTKHQELNQKAASATPTAEGYSRFLGRSL